MHQFDPTEFGLGGTPQLERVLDGPEATRAFGASLARATDDGGFIGLVGDLGAGKTTLVQGLVAELGYEGSSSPTYTLLNEYDAGPGVYHFDLYRLDDVDDLESVAYWDYASDGSAIVLVEWIDRIPMAWAGKGTIIELRHRPEGRHVALWTTLDVDRFRPAFELR